MAVWVRPVDSSRIFFSFSCRAVLAAFISSIFCKGIQRKSASWPLGALFLHSDFVLLLLFYFFCRIMMVFTFLESSTSFRTADFSSTRRATFFSGGQTKMIIRKRKNIGEKTQLCLFQEASTVNRRLQKTRLAILRMHVEFQTFFRDTQPCLFLWQKER